MPSGKILLVQPPYPQELGYEGLNIRPPPLGILYLASILRQGGFEEVSVLDANILGLKQEDFAKIVESEQPKIVGISSLTATYFSAIRFAREAKKISPDSKVIFGGPHVSFLSSEVLRLNRCVDFVVRGEGENTFFELCKALLNSDYGGAVDGGRTDFHGIRGITFRTDGRTVQTEDRPYIMDLDILPFPARDLLPFDMYETSKGRKNFTTIITSRGCPYGCYFCATSPFWGRKWRARKPLKVVKEMEECINEFGVHTFFFGDDSLNHSPAHLEKLCDLMIERRVCEEAEWWCQARADRVSPKLLQKMKKAGCMLVLYGVETGSQEGLDKIGKREEIGTIKRTFELTHRVGIETIGTFILGLPWDTEEGIRKTVEFAKILDPAYVQFTIFTPLPGSQGWEDIIKECGLKDDIDWQRFTWYSDPTTVSKGFNPCKSIQDLEEMLIRAYLQFLFRKKQLPKFVLNPVYRSLGKIGIKRIAYYFLRKHGLIKTKI
ncbi:MAG: radical SAM protein [Candidatus Wukongarchaeota archaeon]|nr:radical SAM protein [Candidatus Wukongarchaeota archaeon]